MTKNTGARIVKTLFAAAALLPALQIRARADLIYELPPESTFAQDPLVLLVFIASVAVLLASVVLLVLTLIKCRKKWKKIFFSILFGVLILASSFFLAVIISQIYSFFW